MLVWGRTWYEKKLGYVAEFCEICRAPQPFRLVRRELVGHLWYLPIGSRHATLHQGTCSGCRTTPVLDPARYTAVAKKPAPIEPLIAATFPRLEQVEQVRIALEHAVRDDVSSLTPEQRRQLIARPFVAVSPMVQARRSGLHFDLPVALSLLSLAVVPALGATIGRAIGGDNEGAGILLGIVASVLAILWEFAHVNLRWVRRRIVPLLAGSLQPLAPTRPEIEFVIGELRKHGHLLGRLLTAADLVPAPATKAG